MRERSNSDISSHQLLGKCGDDSREARILTNDFPIWLNRLFMDSNSKIVGGFTALRNC